MLTFLFLLFPTGEVRSPRWRPVWWLLVVSTVVATFAGDLLRHHDVERPVPAAGTAAGTGSVVLFLSVFLFPLAASLIASLAAVIVRAIYSVGDERLQIKWFATGAALVVLSFLISFAGGGRPPVWISVFQSVAFIFLFSTIAIAVLKYRLYEIDVVINRAVVYGTLAVFITVIYAAIVVGVGTLVGGQSNKFLTAVAAAVIAIAFQPVRERSRRFANRLVYGKRATPYEVLSDFAERVAGTYAVDDVLPRTAHILAEGMGATERRRLGARGLGAPNGGVVAVGVGVARARSTTIVVVPGATATVPVRYQGELLGALSVTKAPGEALTSADTKLLADVASQAGLVLRNVRLDRGAPRLAAAPGRRPGRGTPQDRAEPARRRAAAAGRAERAGRAARARERRRRRRRSPRWRGSSRRARPRPWTTCATSPAGSTRRCWPTRASARRWRRRLARRPCPVSVETDGIGRYEQPVEAAVYFCALEALNNVAKYAGASSATVRSRTAATGTCGSR